jgi:hypothetical protein
VDTTASVGADQADANPTATSASASYIVLNSQPVAVTPQPASGSGASQTFTFTFSHPNGWQNLGVVNVLVSNVLDAKNACYLAYSTPAQALLLVNDAGDAGGPFAGVVALGSAAVIQNSQCAVSLASATGSGTVLTLALNITFKAAFGGNKVFYVAARDQAGNNSNWQALGVWQAPGAASGTITVGNISPGRSTGTTVTEQITVTDTKGTSDLGIVNLLINGSIDARQACYLAYSVPTNTLLLVNDAGDAGGPFAGTMQLTGGSATIQNSQCQVKAFGSSGQAVGNTLTLTLNLTLYAGFAGNQILYVAGRDQAGGNNTGWQASGTWTVQ